MFTPFPKINNPFLVTEPEYTVPPQLAAQQTVYPQMTSTNQMQMFDEALMKNKLDRLQPIKSIYPNPIYSPQITPREYNQPNALQQRLANIPNIVKNIEDARSNFATYGDMNKEGVLLQKEIPTPELDMLMGKAETPYTMDYVPFESEEEMLRNPKLILPDNTPYEAIFNPGQALTMDEGQSGPEQKLPVSLPPVPEELIPYPPKLEYKSIFDLGKSPDYLGMSNENITIPEPDPYISNEPEITLDKKTNPTNSTNPLVQNPKNKFGTPEAYYLGKSMLDATALINNMVQPQPPSIQMKNTYFERQRLNPEPYDTMRSQMRDQGTQAYRLQRENISQASDLMKGLAAVTSGTQQGLMQVGIQQAGAEQAVSNINQQISMQEQAGIAQTQNQETMTNYQIKSAAQQIKDQMISAQLARLGDTVGAYAKYANMKDISNKQDIVNKAAIQSNNEIQNAMFQYQLQKDAMDSDEYKSSWSQHWNKRLDQMSIDKLSDEKYNLVKEYYGESTPRYGDYQRRAMDPVFVKDYYTKKNSADMFQKLYPGGVAPDKTKYANDADYNAAVADYQRYQKDFNAYNTDKSYKTFEQEQDFWSEISNEKNESAERKIFADQYMKDRGIFTSEQFMAAIKDSLERSRQALEV